MRVSNWNPDKITAEIEGRAMDRLEKAGDVVASRARSRCPVGFTIPKGKGKWSGREAGALKKTIRVVRLKGDPKMNVRVYAGSREIFYSRFVEYGTVKMRARPFLRPALNESKGQIKQIVETG